MRICLLITCLSFTANFALAQWEIQKSGVVATLRDIEFVDSLYGWSVGDSATIISTTDGGMTWTRQLEPVDTIEFLRVQFLDRLHGYLAGNRIIQSENSQTRQAVLFSTSDGGEHWQELDLGLEPDFQYASMQFQNVDNGWLGTNNAGFKSWADRRGRLIQTVDAGDSWSVVIDTSQLMIQGLCFYDDTIGYSFWSVAFSNFDDTDVLETLDGGINWVTSGSIGLEVVRDAITVAPGELWAIGFKASHSIDSGKSWKSWNWFSPLPAGDTPYAPMEIAITDSGAILLAGTAIHIPSNNYKGVLKRSTNSGVSWETNLEIPGKMFHSVAVSGSFAWVAGTGGLVISNRDLTTDVSDPERPINGSSSSRNTLNHFPNPFNPILTIRYNISRSEHVVLRIFNTLGEEVATINEGLKPPGEYTFVWDGREFTCGVYFLRFEAGSSIIVSKAVLMK